MFTPPFFINFEAGVLIAGIGVMLWIKNSRDKKEDCELEEIEKEIEKAETN